MSSAMEGDVHVISSATRGVEAALAHRGVNEQSFDFNNEEWKIFTAKSTILASHCYCAAQNKSGQSPNSSGGSGNSSISSHATLAKAPSTTSTVTVGQTDAGFSPDTCQVCRFSAQLSLTHYPEMVFPDNVLRLTHKESGFVIEFNTLDAMKSISTTKSPVQVACSEHWKASRDFSDVPPSTIQPFDWTYCTDYRGTYHSSADEPQVEIEPAEKLDLEKLKQRENILFYEELTLYEDELHDNGVSNSTVKIRVMPSGFFILLRFFLRVDGVLIKLNDTRIHFEVGNSYFLRQFQSREQSFANLSHLEGSVIVDPNLVYPYLPVTKEVNEKVMLT